MDASEDRNCVWVLWIQLAYEQNETFGKYIFFLVLFLTGVSNLENILLGLYNMKIQEMDTVLVGEKNEENKLHSCPESCIN